MNENDEKMDEIDKLLTDLLEPKEATPPSQQELDALGMPAVSTTPSHGPDNEGPGGKGGK